jgi:hypothetical protein
MTRDSIQIRLRPFDQTDFGRLISWVSTPEALGQWCAAFFRHPLDEHQLQRYLDTLLSRMSEQYSPRSHDRTKLWDM